MGVRLVLARERGKEEGDLSIKCAFTSWPSSGGRILNIEFQDMIDTRHDQSSSSGIHTRLKSRDDIQTYR